MSQLLARAAVCLLLSTPLLLVPACDDRPQESGAAAGPKDRGEPTGVYLVRGLIIGLPDPKKPGSDLQLRHERIPDFKDASGATIGMNAMIMPFPIAKGVTLEGFKEGDKVEFTFAAWMQPGQRGWELRSISKLDSETPLDFTAAGPAPVSKPAAGPATPPASK